MKITYLFKKYAKQLDDFWHSRMNPINLTLLLRKGITNSMFGDPTDILKEELYSSEISEFIADNRENTDDEKAFNAHWFIIYRLRIKYKSDLDVWNHFEYWQTPQITVSKKTGDCEDFALLWMKLMKMLEVPSYKCMMIGGYVSNNGIEGHAYPIYFNGIRAVNMDLTYYVRVLKVRDRATFRIPSGKYLSLWWAFNWRSCYRRPYWIR